MIENVKRLFDTIYYQNEKFPQDVALATKVNGQWDTISTKQVIEKVNLISKGLLKLGVKPGDKIALISTTNRTEWCIMDLGILQIGAIDVPVYPNISEADFKYIFNDAQVTLCFLSDAELFAKVDAIKDEVKSLTGIYSFDQLSNCSHWTEVLELGKNGDQNKVEELKAQIQPKDLATLIYTSGTTGVPKGVMLSHENIVMNAVNSEPRLPVNQDATSLSFLPVCHIYERMLVYLYYITGVSIYFAESLETVGDNLREVKPEVFTAVPRLLEKVYDKIMAKGEALTGIKRSLFYWAVDLGLKYEPYGKNGRWYEFRLGIARKLIFSKWKEALGGNVLAVASGSAALQPRLARVFLAAGVPIMEGYGLTETSPVITVNCETDGGLMIGSVGKPIDCAQVKIAEDGEILTKGPCVMMGYYNKPDMTAEVMTEDGWFKTGDIGKFVGPNKDFLKITDRKKEIFKTSGGKYIAPQIMENKYKESRFIEQIMVIGEGQKHPAAIVVPSFDFLKEWCTRKGIEFVSPQNAIQNDRIKERIEREINEKNQQFGKWEQVKKFELLSSVWGVDTGELTPTLKLRRKQILAKYQDKVDTIYGS